jgi:alkylated DNA repair dioxygenase AlkB
MRPPMDLFASSNELRRLPVAGAEIWYLPHLPLEAAHESLLRNLIDETPWRAEEITVWGKRHLQPRLTAWYGDAESRYRYSGIELKPLPWTKTLQVIRRAVEGAARASFNSVLLNYYRDHEDRMGFHSDDEPELGQEPTIASLSLGETRTLILKHRRRKDIEPVRLALESGSLLVMKDKTQRNWKHGIARESRPCGPRVNLTFRRILGH